MTFGNEANSKIVPSPNEDMTVLDNSLTSLGWLQNLRVHDLISPVMSVSPSPDKIAARHSTAKMQTPPSQSCQHHTGISLSPLRKCILQSADFRKHPKKYRTTADKPPFSYSTLILLAIQESKTGRITLTEIYRWVKDNFKYYRFAEPGWQNSIRHNLSLNELFNKIPRTHGKGNHWKINMDYFELLEDDTTLRKHGNYSTLRSSKLKASLGRKRAHSHSESRERAKTIKRKRRESEQKTSPSELCSVSGDLDWISLLGSQRSHSQPPGPKPSFSPPELAQVGEGVLCSPLTLPTTIAATIPVDLPATPQVTESHGSLLEEVVLKQDSPSPQVVLPWAEGNSQSPSCSAQTHPWAESRENTMHEVRNLFKMSKALGNTWSPDHSWSSSSTNSTFTATTGMTYRTPLLRGASIY